MNDNFPPVTIPNSELRFLRSRLLGKEYKIQVALPTGYAEGKETYPVLYVLDADLYFGTIAETLQENLAAGRKIFSIEVPDRSLSALGTPIETARSCYTSWDMAKPSEYWCARAKDLTSTEDAMMERSRSRRSQRFYALCIRDDLKA